MPVLRPLLVACIACVLACAGARSRGSFDGTVYRDGAIAFELPSVPSGWRRVEVDGASIAFRDDANDASVLVNARCGKIDDDTPLLALTTQLLIGSTERTVALQAVEPFDRREALHTRGAAKWDGVAMAHDVFVLKKDGCVYDFVYTGDPARAAAGTPAFEQYVRGFRTLPGSGVVRS
jgi:hypothetical protein